MSHVKAPVKLVLVGPPDTEQDRVAIEVLIAERNLESRVQFLGAVPESQKLELYARCAAVLFPPINEECGYVTIEAMHAAKPVITCTDSGGPLEFVLHKCTGFIVESSEESLAEAISTIADHPRMAAEMGRAGRAYLEELNITWPRTVERLTA